MKYATATTTSTGRSSRPTRSIPGWQPYPDSKYAPLADDDYAPLMVGTWRQLDALARTIYLESVSFDELQQLSKNKEQLSAAVPAIWPIDRSALHNNHIGAFNMRRMHPVLGYIRPHTGIDFGCDRGTPVYATGDARGGGGLHRRQRRLRAHGAAEPRIRLQDPLRTPEQDSSAAGRTGRPRADHRRDGQHGISAPTSTTR